MANKSNANPSSSAATVRFNRRFRLWCSVIGIRIEDELSNSSQNWGVSRMGAVTNRGPCRGAARIETLGDATIRRGHRGLACMCATSPRPRRQVRTRQQSRGGSVALRFPPTLRHSRHVPKPAKSTFRPLKSGLPGCYRRTRRRGDVFQPVGEVLLGVRG